MIRSIHWFRNDLRLTDNAVLAAACAASDELVPIVVRPPQETEVSPWGFPRQGLHRREFRDQALRGLEAALASRGVGLRILEGRPADAILALAREVGADRVYCETIAAPEEVADVGALRETGLDVHEIWQSSLLNPADLPFDFGGLPGVFTAFRTAVERAGVAPRAPSAPPSTLPAARAATVSPRRFSAIGVAADDGSEAAALVHVARYFASGAPRTYKMTRDRLSGVDHSTGVSAWLAVGALSPRTVFHHLRAHEARSGANDGTYWIWFELLWRDFFRFWMLQHGSRLFRARGLSQRPPPGHDREAFSRWCAGRTGHDFVDAGMRELAATGRLSNRMRQVVASYLVHELGCDWRAGAAWFESRLIDYDVYNNHGNWLYIAGRGADPRRGRRFDPDKQAADHDRDGAYRGRWRASVETSGPAS